MVSTPHLTLPHTPNKCPVHENVIPVIHKSTIQPEVVHTTQPIHETHHVGTQHHGISQLPMKTLDEFKSAGGILDGRSGHSHEEYDGKPRPYNEKLATTFDKLGLGHGHGEHGAAGQTAATSGHTGAGAGALGHDGQTGLGSSNGASTGIGGHNSNTVGNTQHSGLSGSDGAFGAGTVGAGAGAAGLAGQKASGHRATDSGVSGIDSGSRRRSSSSHSSDYEYTADGTKVRKQRLTDTLRGQRNVV